ncbi:SPOR domain-containing protein [Profundibacter sp.]
MADIEFGGAMNAPQRASDSGKFTKLVNGAGALMSVALVIGIGVWGYRLLVRDVTGVPVVRALEGPMRIAPENPGGELAVHQGLAVNRVQSDGVAQPVADRVVLAPAAAGIGEDDPVGLRRPVPAPRSIAPSAEATPMAEAGDVEAIPQTPSEITAPALLTETLPEPDLPATVSDGNGVVVAAIDPVTDEPSATDAAVAEALALADKLSEGAEPLGEVAPVTARLPVIPADVPGVVRSPRPLSRPASLDTTAPKPAATQQVASASEVDPSSIPAGTRLAQLGAFESPEIAKQEWDRLYSRFTDYLQGKSRVIQKAESGGRTFYRLRAMGFDDLSDARRFCSALLAENAACIPVKVR